MFTLSGDYIGNESTNMVDPYWGSTAIHVWTQPTNPYHSDISTKDTIDRMIAITHHSATLPIIQSSVNSCKRSTLQSSNAFDSMTLVRCLYWWVKRRVHFTEDEDIVKAHLIQLGYTDEMLNSATGSMDLLISPEVLLSMPQPTGDCDDFSMLLAAMLVAGGMKTSFVTIAADSNQPDRFSHVYVSVIDPDTGSSVPLDASHGSYPGWEAPRYYRKAVWNIN